MAENPETFMVLEGSEEIPVGEFSHVAATWDGTAMKLYVNGNPAGIMTPGRIPTATTCPFFIGGWQDACGFTGGFFHGVIDELSLYNRTLSDIEIAAIHAAGSSGKCPPQRYLLAVGTTPGGIVERDPDAAALPAWR